MTELAPASVLIVLELQVCTTKTSFFIDLVIVLCVFACMYMHSSDMGVHVCVCISGTNTMTPFSSQDVIIQPFVSMHLNNISRI